MTFSLWLIIDFFTYHIMSYSSLRNNNLFDILYSHNSILHDQFVENGIYLFNNYLDDRRYLVDCRNLYDS
jgi:hypothetical protein